MATVQRRDGRRGQAVIEFAFVLPILLVLFFGVLEGSLLALTINSARYAAGEAARLDSENGTVSNADTSAVALVRSSPLGTTSLATISHIDIYHVIQQSNGQLTTDSTEYNSYRLDGTTISSTWPPANRNVTNGSSDFLGVTIYYQYNWVSGRLLASGPLVLTQTYDVRLEPQSY